MYGLFNRVFTLYETGFVIVEEVEAKEIIAKCCGSKWLRK